MDLGLAQHLGLGGLWIIPHGKDLNGSTSSILVRKRRPMEKFARKKKIVFGTIDMPPMVD